MSRASRMRCRRARAALQQHADGALALEARFALEQHLEECADCRALHEGLALADEGLARLAASAAQAGERLDLDVALERLEGALDEAPRRAAERVEPWTAPAPGARWRLVAAAAVVAGLGALAWWQLDERTAEPEAAARVADSGSPTDHGDPLLADVADDVETESSSAPLTDEERERRGREQATARMAEALRAAFAAPLDVSESEADAVGARLAALEAAAARVDVELTDLLASGWPLARLADGLLGHEDAALARAAAHYVGATGDSGAAVRLNWLVDDDRLGAAALEALALAALRGHQSGVDGLRRGLAAPERAAEAVDLLVVVGRESRSARVAGEAAVAVADVLRSSARLATYASARAARDPEEDHPAGLRIVEALTRSGEPAVAALYALADEADRLAEPRLSRDDLATAIAMVPEHGAALARVLAGSRSDDLAFAAARASLDDALLPWLAERARSTRTDEEALAVLGEYPGVAVVDLLARFAEERRLSNAGLDRLAARLLASDAERFAAWIDTHDAAARRGESDDVARRELRALAELLLATDAPAGGPALVAVTTARSLSNDVRTFAALALAEVGDEADAAALVDKLVRRSTTPDDDRTLAAQLLAVARSGGADDLARALTAAGAGEDEQVLAAIDRTLERGALAVGVHRVARALEDRRGRGLAQLQRRTSQ